MKQVHKIIITRSFDGEGKCRSTSRGSQFDVAFEGQTIVTASTEPLLDGARALKDMGIGGKLEMWDTILPYCLLWGGIQTLAGRTVEENNCPPRFINFKSFVGREALEAFSAKKGTEVALTAHTPVLEVMQA
jgi:hypothetical protein